MTILKDLDIRINADQLCKLTLLIPMLYHGWWNLSPLGQSWWIHEFGELSSVRYLVGILEILSGFGLFFPKTRRLSALVITFLMSGACFAHLEQGYSFKNNGFETPLSYMMIALSISLKEFHREN